MRKLSLLFCTFASLLLSFSCTKAQTLEYATFGGGCFWCTEAVFEELEGVELVVSGYSGGEKKSSYKEVSSGKTKHAEVIQITFDPSKISYELLCKVFFTTHDPTTWNKQGNDVGPQYRSVIFYHSPEQEAVARKMKDTYASQVWDDPIVTEIAPFKKFYTAEGYHQDFYENNPNYGYCRIIIDPKVLKFRKEFKQYLKKE